MPLYVYEAVNKKESCVYCRNSFEITQRLSDDKLTKCPKCSSPIYRVIQAAGLTHSKTDLHYRAKRAGFKCLKRVDKGAYEKMY